MFAFLSLTGLAGCYSLRPVGTVVPQEGTRVAFGVNDMGRAALGGSMGPEIDQVEGNLLESDTEAYLVSVTSVRSLRGGEQRWAGEAIRIKREFVSNTYVRKFSIGRTVAATALGAIAIAAIVKGSLLGEGSIEDPPVVIDTNTARKVPRLPVGRIGRPLSPLWLHPHLSRPFIPGAVR